MSEHRNTDRLAVVTGGSEGIGLAIADALARDGADLVLVARNRDRLATAAEEVGRHGTAVHTVFADLSAPDAPARVAAQVGNLTDRVDTLVNNVGTAHFASLADTTVDAMNTMWHLNVQVPLLLSQQLLPALLRTRGSVINISSYWAHKMVAGRPSAAYSATRGALNSMTRALASELGPRGVRVNAVAPGAVRTPTYERSYLTSMTEENRAAHDEQIARSYPLGRLGTADDIATAVVYLASAQWTTGTILAVDGGLTTR
ncbi:SDR family NAD(P)-dependent oxidoreductase [Goodfellowiella coeruleoviolacea]|uniref:Short-chain dehydrogenase n=1 Tax=Goodfellowiella coeruleoviolacea TaxID=334858 RepID=A0AAE3G9Q3_9PSEU|nr:SDR family oxidoreductase [Goodfellowiella coeruleoviolacea]MCP2163848.1 Short-chain dehydrogenase [Goodfellowiella coeruleoviolacea]